ncbi:ATP-dependent DNA/RNA helicase dhx36 [Chamberlinius hualienensis]
MAFIFSKGELFHMMKRGIPNRRSAWNSWRSKSNGMNDASDITSSNSGSDNFGGRQSGDFRRRDGAFGKHNGSFGRRDGAFGKHNGSFERRDGVLERQQDERSSYYGVSSRSDGGGGGRPKHPPGLKGKEIGLWYGRNAAANSKRKLMMELQVAIDKEKINDLRAFLKNNNTKSQDFSSSSYVTSSSSGQQHSPSRFEEWENEEFDNDWLPNDQTNNFRFTPILRNRDIDQRLLEMHNQKSNTRTFREMQSFRQSLPAYAKCQEILDALNRNQAIVISGETGCGKTTQVPQFILDSFIQSGNGTMCNIICTQPRRISAISVAERVAEERSEVCGEGQVGYHIRLENKRPHSDGSIVYCTTGIVLKYLESDPTLSFASHVILDEVHERDLHTDFLMIILKDLLARRSDLKVVIMSATLNAHQFSKYFGNCPMLSIPGFTFPVTEYYLEDVLQMTKYRPPFKDQNFLRQRRNRKNVNKMQEEYENSKETFLRCLSEKYLTTTINCLRNMDEEAIDYDLMKELIKYIDFKQPAGAILVFLPGWEQISKLNSALTSDSFYRSSRHLIIPLHSMMPTISQRSIFDKPPSGVRKIVLATNIAETSITINDVVYVIDCGKIKMSNFDSNKVISTLNPEWVSLANARQRRGRAGRVQSGICFHLYTKLRESLLESYQPPELLRTRLEELCLHIKILKLGNIIPFISKAMDPPSLRAMEISIQLLTKLNALDSEENLTPLGYNLAQLPLDPQTGKMLLLASIFGCIDPILTVAASLSFRDPFVMPLGKEEEADMQKKYLSEGCKSDHLLLIKVFQDWAKAKRQGREYYFCRENFLSVSTLRMLEKMKDQLAVQLNQLKWISSPNVNDRLANENSGSSNLIRAIIFAGLYPNVAHLRIRSPINSRRKRPPPLRTVNDGKVCLHPKSVIATEVQFDSCYLTYHTKVKMDNNYHLVCDPDSVNVVLELRRHLQRYLDDLLQKPKATQWESASVKFSVLGKVANLMATEEIHLSEMEVSNLSAQNGDEENDDEEQAN